MDLDQIDRQEIVFNLKHNSHVLTLQLTTLTMMEFGLLILMSRITSHRISTNYPFTQIMMEMKTLYLVMVNNAKSPI